MDSKPVEVTETTSETSQKKAWIAPEITTHKGLEGVVLSVQCANTFPDCTVSIIANMI